MARKIRQMELKRVTSSHTVGQQRDASRLESRCFGCSPLCPTVFYSCTPLGVDEAQRAGPLAP
jgi:hypothetical protein